MTSLAAVSPAAVVQARVSFGVVDLAIAGIVLTLVLAIVQIPPIPISPAMYLTPIALLLADGPMRATWRSLSGARPLLWLTAALMVKVIMMLVVQPLDLGLVAEIARMGAGWLALLVTTTYAASSPARFTRLALMLTLAGALSASWFLLELGVGEPFTTLRQGLYADIYGGFETDLVETIRSGLTPFRHQLGYQIVALLPVAAGLLLQTRSRLRQLGWCVILMIGLLALTASLQRSSLAAVGIAGLIYLGTGRRVRAVLTLGAVGVVGAILVGVMLLTLRPELQSLAEDNLFNKLQSDEQQLDGDFRLQLQGRAVELLVQHPLGLAAAGLDWNEVGFRHTYRQLHAAPGFYENPFPVHNGYLVEAVAFGVPFLLLTLVTLGSIAVVLLRIMRRWPTAPAGTGTLALCTACAAAGMYSFQTLTHNASLMTLEPSSLFLLSLVLAADHLMVPAVPVDPHG